MGLPRTPAQRENCAFYPFWLHCCSILISLLQLLTFLPLIPTTADGSGFPSRSLCLETELTAPTAPPPPAAFGLVFAAHCPTLAKMHQKPPTLNRNTDSAALPCCLFSSHPKTPLGALHCSPPRKEPRDPLPRGCGAER